MLIVYAPPGEYASPYPEDDLSSWHTHILACPTTSAQNSGGCLRGVSTNCTHCCVSSSHPTSPNIVSNSDPHPMLPVIFRFPFTSEFEYRLPVPMVTRLAPNRYGKHLPPTYLVPIVGFGRRRSLCRGVRCSTGCIRACRSGRPTCSTREPFRTA